MRNILIIAQKRFKEGTPFTYFKFCESIDEAQDFVNATMHTPNTDIMAICEVGTIYNMQPIFNTQVTYSLVPTSQRMEEAIGSKLLANDEL